MGNEKNIRRQIKTTLHPDQEKQLQAVCKIRGERESVIVREAVIKYLRSALSNQVLQQHIESD